MKNKKGITLISLVITIIVLIILASVAIYLSLGNNGIYTRTKQAKESTNKQTATEIINLKITNCQINKYAEKQEMPTLQELSDVLYEDNEIQYVALESKVADKEKVTVGNKTSIFTKLNQYPYEFEINSSLQLASINGVKIANNNETKAKPSTILYPNGTVENPGIITNDQRIEIQNPYPGHILYLVAQIKLEDLWCDTGWIYSSNSGGYGVKATQLEGNQKDLIVIQSGAYALKPYSHSSGDGFGIDISPKSAPFRVKVVCLD